MKRQRKKILVLGLSLMLVSGVFAQGNGSAGINEATQMVTSYFEPATQLIYAIGAVVGLIGGVKVYNKFSSGDPDTSKTAALFNRISATQRLAWQQGDVLSWANESAALTLQIYQGYTPGMLIDDSYVIRYQAVTEQRLQQAAVRLALLLDQSLSAN